VVSRKPHDKQFPGGDRRNLCAKHCNDNGWNTGVFVFRGGSAVNQNETHPTTVQTYTGSASVNMGSNSTCGGSIVSTITVDGFGQNTVSTPTNNGAIGHVLNVGSGANCIQVTRSNSGTIDTVYFDFTEWHPNTGTPALDGSAVVTTGVIPTGTGPYNYPGNAMTLTQRNDLVVEGCACGGNMATVAPAPPWGGDFYDHLAAVWVFNVTSIAIPTMSNGAGQSNSTGVVMSIAITN
jgi:hypothetical protein